MLGTWRFPLTRTQFDEMFATEDDCVRFLARLRWPTSYECGCGNKEWWLTARQYACCTKCRRQQSLRAGTLLQDSRFPLKTWFEVAWHVCEQKNGLSALGLQGNGVRKLSHCMGMAPPNADGNGAAGQRLPSRRG